MKSLAEFIAEKLEESNIILVKENEEQVAENNNPEAVAENAGDKENEK